VAYVCKHTHTYVDTHTYIHTYIQTIMLKDKVLGRLNYGKNIAISGNSKLIASSTTDKTIKIYTAGTASNHIPESQLVYTVTVPDAHTLSVDLNQDGSLLAVGSHGRRVTTWGLNQGQTPTLTHTLTGHTNVVTAVKFSPDGLKIASASTDSRVIIWSVQTGDMMLTFTGHESEILCLAWSPDGRHICSGGQPWTTSSAGTWRQKCGNLLLWDTLSGKQVTTKPLEGHKRVVVSVAFDSKASLVACGGISIVVWSLKRPLKGKGKSAASQAGLGINSSDKRGGQGQQSLESVHSLEKHYDSDSRGDHDYETLMSHAASSSTAQTRDAGGVPVSDITMIDPVVMCKLGWGENFVASIAFSPDGRYLVGCSEREYGVVVWDVVNRQQVKVLEGSWSRIHGVAWSRDGQYIAIGSSNKALRLWRTDQVCLCVCVCVCVCV
jgi:WD40 repeat protein